MNRRVTELQIQKNEILYTLKRIDCKLIFQIVSKPENAFQYCFYLKRNGETIHKTWYSNSDRFEWDMKEEGQYSVVCFWREGPEGKVSYKISEEIGYYVFRSDIYGPQELKQLCVNCDVLPGEPEKQSKMVLVDFLPEAIHWKNDVFATGKPDHHMVEKMREECVQQLEKYSALPVFVIQWNLWKSGTVAREVFWLLEELYDVCRQGKGSYIDLIPIVSSAEIRAASEQELGEKLYQQNRDALHNFVHEACQKTDRLEMEQTWVETSLNGNILTARMMCKNHSPLDQFCFYLICDGKILKRSNWSKESQIQWEVEQEGVYCVQGFVRRKDIKVIKRALAPAYFSQETEQDFCNFLKQPFNAEELLPETLQFQLSRYPFCDIVVISEKGALPVQDIENFVLPKATQFVVGDWNTSVYSQTEAFVCENGDHAIFSGRIVREQKLCIGQDDLESVRNGESLLEQTGHYTCVTWNSQQIVFGADYFGFQRWYYYQENNQMIVANNYHLLLSVLRAKGIRLQLDVEKACVTLSSVSLQLLSQNTSREMDMKKAFQVTPDRRLQLAENAWKIKSSELGHLLDERIPYHEEEYRRQLIEAREEIRQNVRQILEDTRFEQVIVDLSGGLDSRLIYEALLPITQARRKVKINSKDIPGCRDLEIALKINGQHGLPYNDFTEVLENQPLTLADARCRSFFLGIYYSYRMMSEVYHEPGKVHLNGACGEILARPYVSRKYLFKPEEKLQETRELANYLCGEYSPYFALGKNQLEDAFCNRMARDLESMLGDTPLEKMECQYMYFRHGYHFSETLTESLHLKPLQSKKMMRLHQMAYRAHRSIRLQLDMLYALDPAVADMPFDYDMDNLDRERLRPELIDGAEREQPDLDAIYKQEFPKWEKANQVRNARKVYVNEKHSEYNRLNDIMYQSLMRNFHSLMRKQPELCEKVGLPLYWHFKNLPENGRVLNAWYNKITSLLDQTNIFLEQ